MQTASPGPSHEELLGREAEDGPDLRAHVGEPPGLRILRIRDGRDPFDEVSVLGLRVAELLLHVLSLRDVEHDALDQGPSVRRIGNRLVPEPDDATVLRVHPVLGSERLPGGQRRVPVPHHAGVVVGMNPLRPDVRGGLPLCHGEPEDLLDLWAHELRPVPADDPGHVPHVGDRGYPLDQLAVLDSRADRPGGPAGARTTEAGRRGRARPRGRPARSWPRPARPIRACPSIR